LATLNLIDHRIPARKTHQNVSDGWVLDWTLCGHRLRLVLFFLKWRRYSLEDAASGLTGLSNTLTLDREGDAVEFRVQVQRALKLPIKAEDQQRVDDQLLLKNMPLP
jgi:hypothetical protein